MRKTEVKKTKRQNIGQANRRHETRSSTRHVESTSLDSGALGGWGGVGRALVAGACMGIGEALPMALPSRSRHQPVTSLDEELWLSASGI